MNLRAVRGLDACFLGTNTLLRRLGFRARVETHRMGITRDTEEATVSLLSDLGVIRTWSPPNPASSWVDFPVLCLVAAWPESAKAPHRSLHLDHRAVTAQPKPSGHDPPVSCGEPITMEPVCVTQFFHGLRSESSYFGGQHAALHSCTVLGMDGGSPVPGRTRPLNSPSSTTRWPAESPRTGVCATERRGGAAPGGLEELHVVSTGEQSADSHHAGRGALPTAPHGIRGSSLLGLRGGSAKVTVSGVLRGPT